ncbi:1-acyl-sn-glycerol-3-phosphate acyltransferase [Sulfidibacter corallicola]|uniref:1-acyl-sn-glycerol-3-phosphate acyltransferase n=1 Tax=Sulfidibacter corallicola TaxID=2818388 RepID=A0A8A4TY86_SULCO|nr:1-acyl-sn-glycerol-3-phosphate acyltransferase [Sulfidibacter corallicola]QTD51495.1 1-acyl-sn-glycerol-3-phosphate acyltransferase [Sulfidibacter corallicola]
MTQKTQDHASYWLFLSVFLGTIGGLFTIYTLFAGSMPVENEGDSNHLSNLVFVSACLTALLLPILGMMTDNPTASRRWSLLSGGLLMVGIGIAYLGRHLFPQAIVTAFAMVAFLITNWFHKGLITAFPIEKKQDLPGKSLAVSALVYLVFFVPLLMQQPSEATGSLMFLGGFLLAGTSLVLFGVGAPPKVIEPGSTTGIPVSAALSGWLQLPLTDLRATLLNTLLFSICTVVLLLCTLPPTFDEGFWIQQPFWILLLIIALIWGGISAYKLNQHFGSKRNLSLCCMILLVLMAGWGITTGSDLEFTGLALLSVLITGNIFIVLQGQIGRFTPIAYAGQSFGYFYFCVLAGGTLGFVLFRHTPVTALWLFVLATLAGLLILQSLNPKRGVRVAAGEEAVKDDPDQDWEWVDFDLEGRARHHLFSRTAQMLARAMAEIFFNKVRITGTENLRHKKGAIIVANHPNTFLDPLLITAIAPGRLHYWAKSTLWNMPIFGSILDRLGAIPVYRRQDFPEGSPRDANQMTMDVAAQKLGESAHVLIFPEGVSEVGLSLKPLKTGAARLGFQALANDEWNGDVPIVPIGLDYMEPSLFRTNVTIRIGEPVWLRDYRGQFEAGPRETVREVTDALSHRMKDLIPHLEQPEMEGLVNNIQKLYGDKLLQILGEKDETAARMAISEAVNHYQELDPDTVLLFHRRLEAYFIESERLSTPENHPPIPVGDMLRILGSLFSFASYGLITNWIPYKLTGRLIEWFMPSPVWIATAKLSTGALVFAGYYALVGFLVFLLTGRPLPAAILIISMVLSAMIAMGAMDRFGFRFRQLRTLWQAFWTQDTNEELDQMKLSLIQDLERFRESYAFYRSKEQEP